MGTQIGNWLKALPAAEPPAGLADRVQAAQRAALARRGRRRAVTRYGGLALAAGVVMTVALNVMSPGESPGPSGPGDNLQALERRNTELDLLLAGFDTHAGVLDLGTAGTIADLEDRIATIDHGLRYAGLEPSARARLMRQRIDLMQALAALHVSHEPGLEF